MFDNLVNTFSKWLSGDGKNSDIIISSRVRLARNLKRYPFPNKANKTTLQKVLAAIKQNYTKFEQLSGSTFIDLADLTELDRKFLMERHLISHDFVDNDKPAGIIIGKDELISVMINEEDHFRIQSIQSGLEIEKAWQIINDVDDELADFLEFAYSDQYGYLTSCPTNTGTGMRVSVFIHLAGLNMIGELDKIIKDKIPSEITIRGFYGEGSDALGNIFQISNQLTLGRSENAIIERIINFANTFIDMEKEARQKLLKQKRIVLEDRVFRSIGTLKYAKIISSIELVNLLSVIRLGINLNITNGIDYKKINELMVLSQPAHLQKHYGENLDQSERDILRAKLIRNELDFSNLFCTFKGR